MKKSDDSPLQILSTRLAAAGTTATLMYPGDLARALKMGTAMGQNISTYRLFADFTKNHGVRGIFKQGLVPEITRATVMRGFKFIAVPFTHKTLFNHDLKTGSTTSVMISASLASALEACLISPAEVAKVALQFDKNNFYQNSMTKAIRYNIQHRGVVSLWTALPSLIYRQSIWSAVFFASINEYRERLTPLFAPYHSQYPMSVTFQNLVTGFAGGVTATVFNTPGDVVRTNIKKTVLESPAQKMRFSFSHMMDGFKTTADTTKTIVQQQGFKALYRGFGAKAFHLGASGGLMVMFIDLFIRMYDKTKVNEIETDSKSRHKL